MMLNLNRPVQALAVTLLLPVFAAPAYSQEVISYASIFGGASHAENSDLRVEVSGPFTILGTMHYRDGAMGGVAIGRRWANGAAVEGELAFARDRFDHETLTGIGSLAIDGGIDTYTVMINGYQRFENGTAFTPYLGAGAGVAFMKVSALAAGNTARFQDNDTAFAYQAIAGVSYRLGSQTDLALEYRYSGSTTASFTDDPGGSGSVTTQIDRNNQSVLIKLSYAF